MKTPSTFLHDLVHKLSKSEKRYIKVQHGNREKDYLVLMDAILAQKHFDENQLHIDYEGAGFLKNLAVSKRYLYDLILKSIANFGEKTIEDQVFEKLNFSNTLINKGMHRAAFNELKKGRHLAEKYELFELQIMLLGLEKKLRAMLQFNDGHKKDITNTLYEAEKECLAQLINTNDYWQLNQQFSKFQMQFQKIQTKEQKEFIAEIVKSTQFKKPELATNTKSKILFFQANSTYQFMLGNVEKAYENNKQFLDFLEAKPNFLKLYAERYLAVLNNLLIDGFGMGKKAILERGIKRLDKTSNRPEFKKIKNLNSRVFRQKYLLMLNWHLREKEYEKAADLLPEIERGLEQFNRNIEKHHLITFYYLCAYVLFINKKYNQALTWNNKIINEGKEDVVKEIFYFSRILNLLIHFELQNFVLLDSLLLSVPKYLKARREIYRTEKELFSFIRKIRNSINKKEKEKLTSTFQTKLDKLYKEPREKRVFNYLDLRLWVKNIGGFQ